jgi:hypothetical protein
LARHLGEDSHVTLRDESTKGVGRNVDVEVEEFQAGDHPLGAGLMPLSYAFRGTTDDCEDVATLKYCKGAIPQFLVGLWRPDRVVAGWVVLHPSEDFGPRLTRIPRREGFERCTERPRRGTLMVGRMRVEVYVYDGRALLSTKRDREGKSDQDEPDDVGHPPLGWIELRSDDLGILLARATW